MDIAHSRARHLAGQGRFDLAEPWYANAVARAPADMVLLRDFLADFSASLESVRDSAQRIEHHEWLVDFLNQRVPLVSPEDLPEVLDWLASARATLDEATRSYNQALAEVQDETDEESTLARWEASPPQDAATAVGVLQWLSVARGLPKARLVTLKGRLEAIVAYETLYPEVQCILDDIVGGADADDRLNLLGAVERRLQDLSVSLPRCDAQRAQSIRALRSEFEKVSQVAWKEQAEVRSERAWKAWSGEHADALKDAEDAAGVRGHKPDGRLRALIDDLQKLARSLQAIASEVTAGPALQSYIEAVEFVSERLRQTAESQHRRYNEWALSEIQTAHTDGLKAIGNVTTNKYGVAKVLETHLGPIDQRLLTGEVQRCYGEVFEYLFNNLNAPSKTDAFKKDGNKLNVLWRMAQQDKRMLGEF